jgi:acyl-CoA hydrolase
MQLHIDAEACVDATLASVGPRIVLGTPLGIGKPNHLLNAFYRRACADPGVSLTILTALSLAPPSWSSELERRLVAPLRDRLYPGYPELDYVRDRAWEMLPDNVRIIEFFFPPGELLDNPVAQRDHVSISYSHVARELFRRGLNVLAQLVSPGPEGLSLSCNPDLTLDVLPGLLAQREELGGRPVCLLAQLNSQLPYMRGPSLVVPETFDLILAEEGHEFEPFALPSRPVSVAEHFIGLRAGALVRDGGTIQLGIGQLGDALAHALISRHEHNVAYRRLLAGVPELDIGGRGPFVRGLYAASEMLSEGLVALYQRGILSRRVYDELAVQRAVDRRGDRVDRELFEELREAGLTREQLIEIGVLTPRAPEQLDEVSSEHLRLGQGLRGGVVAHAGFFLGARWMYRSLRELSPQGRAELRMSPISFVNTLGTDPALAAAQRRDARFINNAMKVTLAGALASDSLANGRRVSGVGGQHDFATMGLRLPGARFIALVRATRDAEDSLESNIVFDHPSLTLPDHLRDIVVSEYGVAELRGRTAGEVAEALIGVADSRCQDDLVRAAVDAGRLPSGWRVPDHARANLPERLHDVAARVEVRDLLPRFPLGSELSEVELGLVEALRGLKKRPVSLAAAGLAVRPPGRAQPYLDRMELAEPHSLRERVLRRALVYALSCAEQI